MELIPILSLIILVATICTFVLAIGAYMLYKTRERRNNRELEEEQTIQAELYTPAEAQMETGSSINRQRPYVEEERNIQTQQRERGQRTLFDEFNESEIRRRQPTYERVTNSSGSSESERMNKETEETNFKNRRKFMRYTSSGYVEPEEKEENKTQGVKWR